MRIGVDGACWSNRRGYGRFLRELLTALSKIDRKNTYIVYLDPASAVSFNLSGPFETRTVRTSQSVGEAATAGGQRRAADLLRMSLSVREPLDAFFFPSVYSYYPIFRRRLPVIVGIHDTIADRNPGFTFESKWHDLLWRAKVRIAIAQATTILTVSQYSKRSIAEFFNLPAERIAVIQEAASPRFFRQEFPPAARPFVLYAGGISPNKNLARLLEAFAATRARAAGAQLILVGDYTSDGFKSNYAELLQLVERLNLSQDAIFAGFVPDAELARLYNTCRMFAMPSLDEGFGLPAVEAMACGAPAIVSSGNSLEEVVGPGGLIVDPQQCGEIAAAIDHIFFDDGLHRTLAARALERAKDFSWENSARQMMEIFEGCVAKSAP